MPPKRQRRRNSESEEDPAGSGSGSHDDEAEVDQVRALSSNMNLQIEGLTEKRTDVREEAFTIIVNGLKKCVLKDFIQSNKENLLRATKAAILSPKTEKESNLVCSCLNLMAVTMGSDWESEYVHLSDFLKTAFEKQDQPEYKRELIASLGLVTFLWCTDLGSQTLLQFLNQIISDALNDKGVEELEENYLNFYTTILNVIGLLLTTVSNEFILEVYLSEILPNIEVLLLSPHTDLRCATAEAFALICSVVKITEEEKGENYSVYYFNGFASSVDELSGLLETVANGDQRSVNKKDRDRQSATFGPVYKTFKEGFEPSENLNIKGQSFDFAGWEQKQRLDFLRSILDTGFQTHFQNNELIAAIFGVFVESDRPKLTTNEKKAFLQRTARKTKARKQHIAHNRKNKAAFNEDFDD